MCKVWIWPVHTINSIKVFAAWPVALYAAVPRVGRAQRAHERQRQRRGQQPARQRQPAARPPPRAAIQATHRAYIGLHKGTRPNLNSLNLEGESLYCTCTNEFIKRTIQILIWINKNTTTLRYSCVHWIRGTLELIKLHIFLIFNFQNYSNQEKTSNFNFKLVLCYWQTAITNRKGTSYLNNDVMTQLIRIQTMRYEIRINIA